MPKATPQGAAGRRSVTNHGTGTRAIDCGANVAVPEEETSPPELPPAPRLRAAILNPAHPPRGAAMLLPYCHKIHPRASHGASHAACWEAFSPIAPPAPRMLLGPPGSSSVSTSSDIQLPLLPLDSVLKNWGGSARAVTHGDVGHAGDLGSFLLPIPPCSLPFPGNGGRFNLSRGGGASWLWVLIILGAGDGSVGHLGRSGYPAGTECPSPRAGASSRGFGLPRADSGHSLSFCLSFGVGWAVSPSRCQEVEVSIEGLPVLSRPASSSLCGGEAAPHPTCSPPSAGDARVGMCDARLVASSGWWHTRPGVASPATCTHPGSPPIAG